jgi:hypothetical protein
LDGFDAGHVDRFGSAGGGVDLRPNPAGFEDFIRAAGWNLSVAKPEDWVVDMQALIDAAEATGQRVLGPPLGLGDAMPRRYLDD